jgi:hypothetical protein
MTLPSIVISVIQGNEGLLKLIFNRINLTTKLYLDNFNIICMLAYRLMKIVQTVVDCLIRRNLVFGNETFILKLMNNLFILEKHNKNKTEEKYRVVMIIFYIPSSRHSLAQIDDAAPSF